jgi:hypothetical protein
MNSKIEPIRLLVEESGGKVWRTFEGRCLVGGPQSGMAAEAPDGRDGWWSVIRSKAGKFVLYLEQVVARDEYRGSLEVFDSFEEMAARAPERIVKLAAKAMGPKPIYPEHPLDV